MNVGTKTGTFLLCLFAVCSSISAIDSNESEQWLARCRAAGLPILHIETVDSVMPTCEEIAAPEGCFGRGIINNEKVPGQLWIEIDGDTLYDSGAFVNKKSGITIKVRGNTSATAPGNDGDKKPYKIKLQKKADLLLRGDDDTYADKDWVLLRSVLNETLAGNMTNRALHMPWTPAEEVVLLMLNGDFRGLYILTESIERNQTCRIDVSKEGFIYEYDAYWWNEDYSISSVFNPSMKYTFKYPDVEDLTDEQKEYLLTIWSMRLLMPAGFGCTICWATGILPVRIRLLLSMTLNLPPKPPCPACGISVAVLPTNKIKHGVASIPSGASTISSLCLTNRLSTNISASTTRL